jgi:urea-proton symporter
MPKWDVILRISLTASGYNNELQTSEMFSTAGRTVKSGLVASAVVSSWTWAATLLQSSGVAYRYGVSGPFWVGSQ